jgi:hypothetical protein
MAGEESTVGGVTVQQYLAEVERTITDPTYKHTEKEAAKYRKNKIYYTLIASLEEDVMTAINPPKQNTGQFEVNFDGFTSAPLPKKLEAKIKVLTQSIVRARAAFLELNMPAKL